MNLSLGGKRKNFAINVCYIYDHEKQIFGDDHDFVPVDDRASSNDVFRAYALHVACESLPDDDHARRGSFAVVLPFQ